MVNKEQEELLAIALDRITEEFGSSAVLRGGMMLKMLGCARYTNDLDYCFVPYKSKNEIRERLLTCLRAIDGATVQYSMNSQCLRVFLSKGNSDIQVEAKVATTLQTEVISTTRLARGLGVSPRLVQVMNYSVALAHKMAAWNERRLARDLYDIWFFLQMGIRPDRDTLQNRLKKCRYSRLLKKVDWFTGKTLEEFFEFMKMNVRQLRPHAVHDELSDFLPEDELLGFEMKMLAELVKLTT